MPVQTKVPEIGVLIEKALADYVPDNKDLKAAARNFLKCGMMGYSVRVGAIQEGFCDNENISQNPGEVPKDDLGVIMQKLYNTLVEMGHKNYTNKVKQYTDGNFSIFNPGAFTKG